MSRGLRKRENDSLVPQQRGERKSRRTEPGKAKPFTGFTSPYRRLNEQALMQKSQDSHKRLGREASRWENHFTPTGHSRPEHSRPELSRTEHSRPDLSRPDHRPEGHRSDSRRESRGFEHRLAASSPYSKTDLRPYNWRGELDKDKYHSHSNINPWSDKYARQTENFISENKAMKRLNEESVYGKVSWEYDVPQDESAGKNYEKPMDPKEFREQCRRAYVRAAEERQRNAELSVWGKCDWATYDRYKTSRP